MRAVLLIAAIFIYAFFGCVCYGQNPQIDTSSNKATKEVITYFNKAIGQQSEIFNGSVYTLFPSATRGTFYFEDKNSVTPARIIYNGTLYNDVPAIYDVYHDEMISFANNQLYVLVPENLSEVFLNVHHFVNIRNGKQTGYFEELYNGKSQVLLKRTKLIEEHIVPPQTAETWYIDKSQLYINVNEKVVEISGKNALLKAFNNRRKEIEHYLSENNLDFAKEPEKTAVKAAAYYDQISR